MKFSKQLLVVLVLSALTVFAAACGNGSSTTDKSKSGGDSAAPAEPSKETPKEEISGSIVLSGSSALQPLAAAAAEQFMAENPKADIQVQGGGSGTGLSQVSEGAVDIGNSDVFAEEKDGIPADQLVDHKVAVVGMTAGVNPEVGVTDISKADLIKVFTGEIKNWKDLGGKDQEIVLVNRPDSSGTRATFVKYALDGATPAEGITEDSSNTVKKLINETPGAIGYLAFSYFTDDKVIKMSIDGVEASDENVQKGDFPIWAYEHMYTKGEASGLAQTFLDYMVSDAVQTTLVPDQGYISASKMQIERNAAGEVTKK